jgi:hypothetical protein
MKVTEDYLTPSHSIIILHILPRCDQRSERDEY